MQRLYPDASIILDATPGSPKEQFETGARGLGGDRRRLLITHVGIPKIMGAPLLVPLIFLKFGRPQFDPYDINFKVGHGSFDTHPKQLFYVMSMSSASRVSSNKSSEPHPWAYFRTHTAGRARTKTLLSRFSFREPALPITAWENTCSAATLSFKQDSDLRGRIAQLNASKCKCTPIRLSYFCLLFAFIALSCCICL